MRRWRLGGPSDFHGLSVWVVAGSKPNGDLLMKIDTGGRWLVPKALHVALLADYLADNEAHNRPNPESGNGYTRAYLDIAARDGWRAAVEWDEARRNGTR